MKKMDIGTALILLRLSPLIGFGIGTARHRSDYARRRWELLAGYYLLLLGLDRGNPGSDVPAWDRSVPGKVGFTEG
ncbi:MAG: hypothetical protein JSV78_04740 [Phycisphaerales bacterium]|nr:MAG: hypothetical protein JSV78_04740 [Phycisphaerales bacterium]